MIATNRARTIATDQMYAVTPEQAWVNDMAGRLYENDATSLGFGRAWEPTELIGTDQEVVITNGLTGEDHEERRVSVVVTAEMVEEAERLAKTF